MKCNVCGQEHAAPMCRARSSLSGMATLLAGAGIGVGLMYFLDSAMGKRRRARVRDRIVHGAVKLRKAADAAARDGRNRIFGSLAGFWSLMRHNKPSDDVLVERLKSRIGRCVAHPSYIEVDAADGRVSLSGPVLDWEEDDLISAVKSVRGVKEIENRLDVRSDAEYAAGQDGRATRHGKPFELMQDKWSPAVRVVTGAAGCGLMANCLARCTPVAVLAGTAGFAVFTTKDTKVTKGYSGFDCAATSTSNRRHDPPPQEASFRCWPTRRTFPG